MTVVTTTSAVSSAAGTSHATLANLTAPADDHTQYALLAGRVGGQTLIGGTAAGNQLNLVGSSDAALGRVFVDSPLELGDVILGDQVAFRYRPTFSVGVAYIGGMIASAMDVTFSNSLFIYALLSEGGQFRQAVAPGFAAFTLFNALPRIVNSGDFNLVQALVLNAGPSHERSTVGTSTTVQTIGVSFAPQARARANGATMTYTTGMTGLSVAPTFSTVAGSFVNFGTIRGVHCRNPALGLFQTGGGTEAMTAYIGVDVDAIPFGGNVTKRALRSAIINETNALFLENTGGAWSDHGSGFIRFDDNAGIIFGTGTDVFMRWNSVQLAIETNTFFGIGNSAVFFRPDGDNSWEWFSVNELGLQYNVENVSFGTTNAAPNLQNWFVIFTAPNGRQPAVAGEYADVLWTAGGNIDIDGLTMGNVQAFKINSPSVILNGGTIDDLTNLFVEAMPSFGATRVQAMRVLGRSRVDGHFNQGSQEPAQLTADTDDWALGENNNQRGVVVVDSDGNHDVSGIDASFGRAQEGDRLTLINSSANTIRLTHQDTGSLAANRFITPNGNAYVLKENETVDLWYDDTGTDRWRILTQPSPIAPLSSEWQLDSSVVMADPGLGEFRNNNATIGSVTAIAISDETKTGVDAGNILAALASGDQLYIQNLEDASEFLVFDITGNTDNTGWHELGGTVNASGSNFTAGKEFLVTAFFA